MLACAQITIRDETDIHVGSQPPSTPILNQLWLNTSVVPNTLHRWNGVEWVAVGQDFDLEDYYTIEELNTLFAQTNQEIALKADKTVTDSLGNRISSAESMISVQAGQITSAVSTANTALTNINNLAIGGRNYLLNSRQQLEKTETSTANKWMQNVSMSPDFLGDCKLSTLTLTLYAQWENLVLGANPWIGISITFADAAGADKSINFNVAGVIGSRPDNLNWLRIYGQATIPEGAVSVKGCMCTLQGGYVSGAVRIRNPMVEKGTKHTDYRPAPEDDEYRLTVAESRITQNASNINLKVAQSVYDTEKVYRSNSSPTNPALNMLWLNTGTSPFLMSRWTGSVWEPVGADKVIASGINITPNDITMRTTNFILQLLDSFNPENVLMEMRADGNVGFKKLFAEQVVSNSVVTAYTGSTTLYVDPMYTGSATNYFRSLREACESLNGKYLRDTVNITFANSNYEFIYENAGIILKGVSGPGRIFFYLGNRNKYVVGYLYIDSCAVAVFIDGLNIRESRPINGLWLNEAVVQSHHCNHVSMAHVVINGNNVTNIAYKADYTNTGVWDVIMQNVNTAFHLNTNIGVIEDCYGTVPYAMWSNSGIIFCVGMVPYGSRVKTKNGVIYETGASQGGGGNPGQVTPEYTATFYSSSRTYRGGVWRTDTYDLIQGAYNDAGYTSSVPWNYGCCWFANLQSSLSGRSVKSASMTITRKTGSGSGSSVNMYLYAISNTGASGSPGLLVNLGAVGSIGRGETLKINLPANIVQGLVNWTYGGLCLYESSYNFGKSAYSSGYSRYDAPSLYVVYT